MKTSQDQERANNKRQVTKEKEKLHRTMSAQGSQLHQGSGMPEGLIHTCLHQLFMFMVVSPYECGSQLKSFQPRLPIY